MPNNKENTLYESDFQFMVLKKVLLLFDKFYVSEEKLPKATKMGKFSFFVNNEAKNCIKMVGIMLNYYDITPKNIYATKRGPMVEICLIQPFLHIFINFLYSTIANFENLGNR